MCSKHSIIRTIFDGCVFSLAQPENIALKEKDGKVLKIIDFGTAQDLSVTPKPKVMVGTPEFIGGSVIAWLRFIALLPAHTLTILHLFPRPSI